MFNIARSCIIFFHFLKAIDFFEIVEPNWILVQFTYACPSSYEMGVTYIAFEFLIVKSIGTDQNMVHISNTVCVCVCVHETNRRINN